MFYIYSTLLHHEMHVFSDRMCQIGTALLGMKMAPDESAIFGVCL